jgi:hypothetical protein
MIIHFKKNEFSKTGCGKSNSAPKNIDWNKVNCRECLMIMRHSLKKKRS